MNSSDRQKRIGEFLRPQSVHHGQLETYLIAVPPNEITEILPDRESLLRESLEQQQSNLIPLIVRRTEAYQEEEYEVVYGAEWCLVAKELKIERLWVWVFDLTDEQAGFFKTEMEQLLGTSSPSQPNVLDEATNETRRIEDLIRRLETTLEKKLQERILTSFKQFEEHLSNKILSENRQFSAETAHSLEEILKQRLFGLSQPIEKIPKSSVDISYKYVTLPGLKEIARRNGIEGISKLKKEELIKILQEEGVALSWKKPHS